jgi:hypothetical protein
MIGDVCRSGVRVFDAEGEASSECAKYRLETGLHKACEGDQPVRFMMICKTADPGAESGDFLKKLGRFSEARNEFELAATLTRETRERDLLLARAEECGGEGA